MTSDANLYQPSRSRRIEVSVPSGTQVPSRWYGWGLGFVLALVIAVRLFRRPSWLTLLRFLRKLRPKPRSELAVQLGHFIEPNRVNVSGARSDWFKGVICDRHSDEVLDAVSVLLEGPKGESLQLPTDVDGRFEAGPLSKGRWHLEISCPGYEEKAADLHIPHAGELDGARFFLTSERHAERIRFAESMRSLGHTWRWGYDTIREALNRVSRMQKAEYPDLERHGTRVETAWYRPAYESTDATTTDLPVKEDNA